MTATLERICFYLGILALVAILACAAFGADPAPPGQPAKEITAEELLKKVDGLLNESEEQGEHKDRVEKLLEESGKRFEAGRLIPDNDADEGEVRFIRLEYDGKGWDDGMGATKADVNFLKEFGKLSGPLVKVAGKSESHPISHLRLYPKGQAPPFVYMTGKEKIGVSEEDLKILREHLQGGGLLFADCGSPQWDKSFRAFAKTLFPENALRVVPNDDPIFRIPFTFRDGAPPLWHHGGKKAMGVKLKGRWCVFYFPGDLNDAWKTGHSGIDPELAQSAYHLGMNIVYYSFTHYLRETRKYRK